MVECWKDDMCVIGSGLQGPLSASGVVLQYVSVVPWQSEGDHNSDKAGHWQVSRASRLYTTKQCIKGTVTFACCLP